MDYASYALAIYGGILADATTRWPSLKDSLDMDLSYLRRAVENRGLPFLTIVLPDTCKWLDQSLDAGHQLPEGIPQGMPIKQGRPKLFGGLLNLVFDDLGLLKLDVDHEAVLFLRTLYGVVKKLRMPPTESSVKETLDEFFLIERQLPPSHPDTWDSDVPVWGVRRGHPLWGDFKTSEDQIAIPFGDYEMVSARSDSVSPGDWSSLRHLCRRVVSAIGEPDWWEFKPRHGPGAVAEGQKGSKYSFPNWPRKLDLMFPYDWFGSGLFAESEFLPADRDIPSRLIAVPKSQKGPRLICAEPIANQFIQQGVAGWLEGRILDTVLRWSITLRSQEASRERALLASIDGREATIDLSSASDRISTRLVEYVFGGSPLLDAFHACRTRSLTQTISDKHDRMCLLRKFSTMGSALTFPVQSILFTILSVWGLRLHEGRENDWTDMEVDFKRVRVYGDDIIAPTHAIGTIKLVLSECGLRVNEAKSFTGSNFRESCGCDAFQGVDVTPARCLVPYDGSPSSLATHLETSNNFHKKGMWKTASELVSMVPEAERKLLPIYHSEELGLGLFSYSGASVEHLKKVYDRDLQREFSVALGVTSTVDREQSPDTSGLSQYFHE
ncbi:RNA-directed RNA polymerase, partial [ssRNA phage Gerhypos.2_13]